MRQRWTDFLVPAGVAATLVVVVNLWALGAAPLGGTEGFRAVTAHQMVDSARWLLPRLYGELYLRKPPMHYWILAGFETVLGPGEVTWRLPGVLGAGLLAGFLAIMGGRWFGRIGAWTAGLSLLAVVALWEQTRSADIDATNTVAAVVAAVALLEIGFGPGGRRRWAWSLLAALAIGATLLLKGHQGLIVVGGALLGGSLATRQWRWLVRPSCWGAVLGGVAMFGAWVAAAWWQVQRLGVTPDLSGVSEASYNTLNLARLMGALAAGVLLVVYALPLSLVLLTLPRLWQAGDEEPEHAPRLRRALLGTVAASLAIMVVNGVVNPRYGYVMLPVWCLLAAATASLWRAGQLGDATRLRLRQAATGLAIVLPVAQLWLTATLWPGSDMHVAMLLAALTSVTAGLVGVAMWIRQAVGPGLAATGLVVVALMVPVADRKTQDRRASSAHTAAALLVARVPPGTRVTAAQMLRDKPELFYYARLPVDARFHAMDDPTQLAGPQWIVFSPTEWQRWSSAIAPRAHAVHDLDGKATLVHLAPR